MLTASIQPAVLIADIVYSATFLGHWKDLHDVLHQPNARPGLLFVADAGPGIPHDHRVNPNDFSVFVPFDQKIPYIVTGDHRHGNYRRSNDLFHQVRAWKCRCGCKSDVEGWKKMTKMMGEEKRSFVHKMLGV